MKINIWICFLRRLFNIVSFSELDGHSYVITSVDSLVSETRGRVDCQCSICGKQISVSNEKELLIKAKLKVGQQLRAKRGFFDVCNKGGVVVWPLK